MAIKRTTATINKLASGSGVNELFNNGVLYIYSGGQPSSADDEPTGTQLIKYTTSGLGYTNATRSLAQIAIGGSAAGALDSITIGGMSGNLLSEAIPYTTTASNTVALITADINSHRNPMSIVAEANGTYVDLFCPYQLGAYANGLTFSTATSGALTATSNGVFSGGVTAVNGLTFSEVISDGAFDKTNTIWQGSGLASGTAGWFRFVAAGYSAAGDGATEIRFDGSVGTNNADLTVSSTTVEYEAIYVINSGTISIPSA